MKKFTFLLVVMLIVSFSFAQIQPKVFRQEAKVAGTPELKIKNNHNSKTGAAAQWLEYAATIYEYNGSEPTSDDWAIGRVAADSNGLTYYSDGDVGHGFWFGLSQTYDFTHSIWDDVAMEGDISMNNTNSYNIDSVCIIGHYNRGASVPAGDVDTLVVAILTTLTEDDFVTLSVGQTPIVRYYGVPYDVNTHMSVGATLYKVPLTADDCAEVDEETGGLYMAEYYVPVHLENITGKVVNVAYTLRRGYTVPVDDNIQDHSRFYGAIFQDPRADYYPYSGTSWFTPSDEIFYNPNQGAIISDDNLNQPSPNSWYCKYFYPAPVWNRAIQYPWIITKVSCNDCAIVNVPEIEKNNLTVYPNPATNRFTVNTGNDEKASIQLFNIVGQQVYSETFTGSTTVSVTNLHSGVYMLKVNQNGKVSTTKVVVK